MCLLFKKCKLLAAHTSWKNYAAGFRKVTVLNPGLCVHKEDETGTELWGTDPVHPLYDGYKRIVDLVCGESTKLREQKREGDQIAHPA
jgi:hypothetical protein